MLVDAIVCVLVNCTAEALALLAKAREWGLRAIASGEIPANYTAGATEADRYYCLGLSEWLLTGQEDAGTLSKLAASLQQYPDLAADSSEVVDDLLPSYAVQYLFAKRPDLLCRLCDRCTIDVDQLSESDGGEFELAREIARGTNAGHPAVVQESQVDSFLRANIDVWLCHSKYVRVAAWMKILFWDAMGPNANPRDCLNLAHRYLSP
jgi:hypothetical protein